jgi:hypothetical protein
MPEREARADGNPESRDGKLLLTYRSPMHPTFKTRTKLMLLSFRSIARVEIFLKIDPEIG